MTKDERFVILASSLGTVFEWYDFYLYGSLASIIGAQFFSAYPPATRDIFALLAFAAGFLVRPFGAIVFGRVGDIVGRKYTFLVTIMIMGLSTFLVGLLPGAAQIGFAAPVILISLRLLQGLALGGEYGGAATYVAEHAPQGKRGYYTSFIQTTATLGLFLSLLVILFTRTWTGEAAFAGLPGEYWGGWRIPFLVSVILLGISVWIRLRLNESPVFQKMKDEGKGSKAPLTEAFANWSNAKIVIIALVGGVMGQGVVWYTGQFYALFFMQSILKVDGYTANLLIAWSLLLGTGFFIVFGALSDKIGRKKIILAGCLIAAVTYVPLFHGLTHYINPDLEAYQERTPITVTATDCNFHIFIGPWSRQSACDKAKDFLGKSGLSFTSLPAVSTDDVVTKIGDIEIKGWDEAKFKEALKTTGYPLKADLAKVNWFMAELILVIMVIYVTMVYGPIAAFLVELFPARIRYTSMSLPYHIGNGWFGGMLPLLATSMVAKAGNIYYGLWYPIIVALITFVIGLFFLKETKDVKIHEEH
jgi:MFS family permease